jgi:polar amino acid transport system permease protein
LIVLFLWSVSLILEQVMEPIGSNASMFAEGTKQTLYLTLVSGGAGIFLGVLAALGKISGFFGFRWIAGFYIWVIRGTPLLVQILFVYLALPILLPELQMSEFVSACIALSFNVGAYNAEAVRAGLLAVPIGQVEAARSLGMSGIKAFCSVSFPQAFKISLPPLVNNFVALLKDSSLAYSIGVVELTNIGNRIQSSSFEPVPVLITVAAIYLTLTTLLTGVSDSIERFYDIEGRIK